MADPGVEDIQKLLDRIAELRKTIAQAGEPARATLSAIEAGLRGALLELGADPQGKIDAGAWARLSASAQSALRDRLRSTTELLQRVASGDTDGPTDPKSIMFKAHASNFWIVVLTLAGIVFTVAVLGAVGYRWDKATEVIAEVRNGEGKVITPGRAPSEGTVLLMIIFMGLLGGCLHWTSSLAMFIGNGQLLRRWIPYYLIMPFEGAALAPVIYLLLRIGVLGSGGGAGGGGTASLNLVSLYAFAALTGLFAKQAIEMLADVFTVIFKKIQAKDAIPEKPVKQEGGQTGGGGSKTP